MVDAFSDLTTTTQQIDSGQLAQSLETLATTFKDSPADVKASLDGLSRLSETIASRDDQLRELLSRASAVSGTVASRNDQVASLIQNGDSLLQELDARRAAIHTLFLNTSRLAQQLTGLVSDNRAQLTPALAQLHGVLTTSAVGADLPQQGDRGPRTVHPGLRQRPRQRAVVRRLRAQPGRALGRARPALGRLPGRWLEVTPGPRPAVLIARPRSRRGDMGAAILWWPSSDQVRVTAHLSSAVGLYPGSDVRILGVKVGKVLSVTPAGASDTVRLEYDGKYRVPADAKAAVVSPSLVSDRYLQLLPAYTGGAAMHSGADIPLARTAVPVELDQVTGNLDQLTKALGPNGANSGGALSDLLDTASKNLDGNGPRINDTIANLSQATATLAGGKDDLFTTVKNLQSFTSTLAANDPQVRAAQQPSWPASPTSCRGSGTTWARPCRTSPSPSARSRPSSADNRSVLTTDVSQLADVTSAVAKQKDALAETLRNAPVALSDLGHAYDPASGTLDNRVDLPGAEGVSQLLCALIAHGSSAATSARTAQACSLLDALGDRLGALGADPDRRPAPGAAGERLVTTAKGGAAPRRTPIRWAATGFALLGLALLTGCQGAYDLPLPGGSAMDGHGYQVTRAVRRRPGPRPAVGRQGRRRHGRQGRADRRRRLDGQGHPARGRLGALAGQRHGDPRADQPAGGEVRRARRPHRHRGTRAAPRRSRHPPGSHHP